MSVALEQSSNQEKISELEEMLRKVNRLGRGKSPQPDPQPKTQLPKQAGSGWMEKRLMEVEGRLESRLEEEWGLVERVDAEMAGLQEEVRLLRRGVERTREGQELRVREVEQETSGEVAEEVGELKFTRKELAQLVEKKYKTIKGETMEVIGTRFEDDSQARKTQIGGQLGEVRQRLELGDHARDETVNFMVASFGDKILELEQEVQREREARSETHQSLLDQLQSVGEGLQSAIQGEKREGAAGMASLEGYLQQLCFKIEKQVFR